MGDNSADLIVFNNESGDFGLQNINIGSIFQKLFHCGAVDRFVALRPW
jgi:hypothetical protein